jgi:hypothetical protein
LGTPLLALGRLENTRKTDLVQTARKLTEEEWNEVIAARIGYTLATIPDTLIKDVNNELQQNCDN